MNNGRISRVTFPTASFSLTTDLIEWISREAERLGMSKSEFVRHLMAEARQNDREHGSVLPAIVRDGDAA